MAEWRLGSYELLRRLGEGGMAQVYLARDVRLGREVAVKVLDRKLAERPGFRERFMREARVAAALDHPNIVPLFDFGDTEALYLVMPYVSGGSLQDLLPRAPLQIGEVVTYGSQIADALEYAHQRKVVHRDVKPANMLVHADGRLMLSDFGLAKIVNATHKLAAPRNRPDAGTPEYMAPEQVIGSSDARSDIYGLGVVLYLLLAGRLPFSGSSSHEVMQAHLYKEPAPLRRYNPTVPVAMEAVIMRAMAKQPAERFQRANELGAALLSALIADHGDAPTFVISSTSHGGSRPTGQAPIAMPPAQAPDVVGDLPPWRQQGASQSVANSEGASASAVPPTPASSNWETSRASASSSLTGILPNLNMPFTSFDSSQGAPSATNQMSSGPTSRQPGQSGFGARSAHSGFSGLNNASSFAGASGIGGAGAFTDSQVTGAAPGMPNARTLGQMPTVHSTYPPAYPPPVYPPNSPPVYPPTMNSGAHRAYVGAQTRQISQTQQQMPQQMPQSPFGPGPVAPLAPTYGDPIARGMEPHVQRAEVRATLPGSRMTEPPPAVESRERRSLFWVVIALLLIMLVLAVIVLLRWLEAGSAAGAVGGFAPLFLG